ncbi:MAG TPA: hypothetical protein DCS26_02565 [Porticoccaceae bacterium]|nr:hypothetical protein [Porticoccaceae bacterium]
MRAENLITPDQSNPTRSRQERAKGNRHLTLP